MKRLLALAAGGLGLTALLRRRVRPVEEPSPADELRAKLAASKEQEPPTVDERRADVHAQARQALDDLRQ